jgi:hypothetical protein
MTAFPMATNVGSKKVRARAIGILKDGPPKLVLGSHAR